MTTPPAPGSIGHTPRQNDPATAYRNTLVQLAFEAADVGLWDFDLETGRRYWSPSVKASFGLPPDTEVTAEVFAQGIHPDDRARVFTALQRAADPGERALYDVEYRTVSPAGGAVRWVAAKGRGLFDADGRCLRLLGTALDVTDRKEAEARHRATAERLELLDRIGVLTRAMTDPGRVMQAAAQLLGEHLGATRCAYADVEPDGDRFTIRNDWSRPGVPSSAGAYSLDLFGPQATSNLRRGQHLVVNDVDAELGDDGGGRMFQAIGIQAIVCAGLVKDGRLVAMMAVHQATPRRWTAHEITLIGDVVDRCWAHIERIRTAAILQEQDQRKDEFLATLAHELRNPLAPLMFSTALLRRGLEPDRHARALDVIERQSSHLVRLIDDLLDVSRINRGLIELKRRVLPLAPLLEQALDAARPALERAQHTVVVSFDEAPCPVDVDPARLVQAVTNLLNNAAKYTPDGGEVRLSTWTEGDEVVVEVRDTGVGIPMADQARLFQLFSQLPHTGSRAQGGLGIGLSLVRRLVEMHGGTVAVFSEGLGEGSAFRIRLPRAAALAPEERVVAPAVLAAGHARVLVVEDNDDGRDALLDLLQAEGHEARGAATGPAGWREAGEFLPDIVLLDLGLPLMNGYEVASRIRADDRLKGTMLVALTGWGTDRDREMTSAAGFDAHLTKPVEPARLLQLLSAWSEALAVRHDERR